MEKKLSAKDFLRSIFAKGGRYTMEQLLNGGMYKEVTMRTAITDLKNPKYAGGPVLFIENDGKFFFTREQSGSAPVAPETAEEDAVEEDEVSLVDQIPDDMPIAKGLAAWIEDGAGLVLGAFNASFEINDDKDKFTASIELDGTPSTFTEGGRRMSVSSGDGEAVVQVENEDDGRSVRFFIEAIEHGFTHAFSYALIEIPVNRRHEALELCNSINMASKLAHVYIIEIAEHLMPCIKCSSVWSGDSEAFENVCYASLEVTYRYWSAFEALGADSAEISKDSRNSSNETAAHSEIIVSGDGINYDYVAIDEETARRWMKDGLPESELDDAYDDMTTESGIREGVVQVNGETVLNLKLEQFETTGSFQVDGFGEWLLVVESFERGIFSKIDIDEDFDADKLRIDKFEYSFNGPKNSYLSVSYNDTDGEFGGTDTKARDIYILDPNGRITFLDVVED